METPPPNTQARNMSNLHVTKTDTSITSSADYYDKYHKSLDRSSKVQSSTIQK